MDEQQSRVDVLAHQSIGALTFQVDELRARLARLEHPAQDDGKGLLFMVLFVLVLIILGRGLKSEDE